MKGREVSSRVVGVFLDLAKGRGIGIDSLAKGMELQPAQLTNKQSRMSWDDHAVFMRNVGAFLSSDELVEAGRSTLRSPFRALASVARLLFTAADFYEWVTVKAMGAGNQMFSCVEAQSRRLNATELEIRLGLPPGYSPCPEFFLVTKGVFSEMPAVLGLRAAEVKMVSDGASATYTIELPPGGGWLGRLKRFLLYPFSARDVALGLKEANEALVRRLDELSVSQAEASRRRKEIEVISIVSTAAHSTLDLEAALRAICVQVCQQLGYRFASITVKTAQDGLTVAKRAEFGDDSGALRRVVTPLVFRDVALGELVVAKDGDITAAERQFLSEVATTCALAINNSVAFEVIQSFRRELEERVEVRTSQLRGAIEQIEHQQGVRQRIFQNISHELRTPLSLISLSVDDVVRSQGELSERSVQRLKQIDDSSRRLLHLFDGMLLLAAGQEQRLRIRPTRTDVAALVRSMTLTWRLAAERQQIQLQYSGLEKLMADVDVAGVERIVSNLLSNAIKFTPSGGTIDATVERLGDQDLRIAVRDSGVGMDAEFLSRAFGRFEQGPTPVRAGERGSGIGLAIVREIATAHGGTARVDSVRGRGSTFWVTLPLAQAATTLASPGEGSHIPDLTYADPSLAPAPARLPAAARTEAPSGAHTVLVAEDDPELREFLVELLGRDHRVVAAPDGLAALQLAEQHQPSLLVSDVDMPGLDGIELAARFRERTNNRLAPVILLTAYAHREFRVKGLAAGAVDYVTKPFDPDELTFRVKNQLALRDMALRLHESQKLAGLGTLSAGLAHELRNPANTVVNAVGPLLRLLPAETVKPGTPSRMLLDALSTAGEQIATLSRQLLGFSRHGDLEVHPESLERIISASEALVGPALGLRRIRRDLKWVGQVRCARGLVVQVLVNLLENAVHASPDGSEITLSTGQQGERMFFEVRDQGSGVPAHIRERVFDPFFTTKPPGQGTGLGLSISRLIAERQGGVLRLMDSDGGAVFRLELAIAQPVAPREIAPSLSAGGTA